jgi:hypothetical protein
VWNSGESVAGLLIAMQQIAGLTNVGLMMAVWTLTI